MSYAGGELTVSVECMLDGFNQGWTKSDRTFILLAKDKHTMFQDYLLVASQRAKRKVCTLDGVADDMPARAPMRTSGWSGTYPPAQFDRRLPTVNNDDREYAIDKMVRTPCSLTVSCSHCSRPVH